MSLRVFGCATALICFVYLSQTAFDCASNSDFDRRDEPPPPPQPASSTITTIARRACLNATCSVSGIGQTADGLDRLELLEGLPAGGAVANASTGSRPEQVLERRVRRAAIRAPEDGTVQLDEGRFGTGRARRGRSKS